MSDESNLKQSIFGGENMADAGASNSNSNSPVGIVNRSETQVNEAMLRGLLALKRSLEEEREEVMRMICLLNGEERVESNREEQLLMVIESLRKDLEDLKKTKLDLEMEVEFLKLSSINASD